MPAALLGAVESAVALFWRNIDQWSKFAEMVALFVGGVAAYYRFFRGRVYAGRLEIALGAEEADIAGVAYFTLGAALKNIGAARLDFDSETSSLTLYSCDGYAANYISAPWELRGTYRVFSGHEYLEAGETIQVQRLILASAITGRIHMVVIEVQAGQTYWIGRAIVQRRSDSAPNGAGFETEDNQNGRPVAGYDGAN